MKVKYIEWDQKKNEVLKDTRGISFEDAMDAVVGEGLKDIREHPNAAKYGHQKIFVIDIHDYIYFIPYVEDEEKIFLKTIIPSRKLTKQFIEEEHI